MSIYYFFGYFSSKSEVLTNSAGLICPTCKQTKKAYKKKAGRCKEQSFVNAKTNHRYMTNEQLIRKEIILIGPLHDAVTWYRTTYTGEQVAQWDFQSNAWPLNFKWLTAAVNLCGYARALIKHMEPGSCRVAV